jgi:hypothetical protein
MILGAAGSLRRVCVIAVIDQIGSARDSLAREQAFSGPMMPPKSVTSTLAIREAEDMPGVGLGRPATDAGCRRQSSAEPSAYTALSQSIFTPNHRCNGMPGASPCSDTLACRETKPDQSYDRQYPCKRKAAARRMPLCLMGSVQTSAGFGAWRLLVIDPRFRQRSTSSYS